MRTIQHRKTNASNFILLLEDGRVIGEWRTDLDNQPWYDYLVALRDPRQLELWDATHPDCTDPDDWGEVVERPQETDFERFAALLRDDGQVWETKDGRHFDDLLEDFGAVESITLKHLNRPVDWPEEYGEPSPYDGAYRFRDGSNVCVSNGCWDSREGWQLA